MTYTISVRVFDGQILWSANNDPFGRVDIPNRLKEANFFPVFWFKGSDDINKIAKLKILKLNT
jgi:hypothetical protein